MIKQLLTVEQMVELHEQLWQFQIMQGSDVVPIRDTGPDIDAIKYVSRLIEEMVDTIKRNQRHEQGNI